MISFASLHHTVRTPRGALTRAALWCVRAAKLTKSRNHTPFGESAPARFTHASETNMIAPDAVMPTKNLTV